MHIAICDDNASERCHTAELIAIYAAEHALPVQIKQFSDAREMLRASESESFTHFFLDIVMPEMDGLSAGQEIRRRNPEAKLVFITSFKEYAYQSYRLRAQDYLLKPVDKPQIDELMSHLASLEAKSGDYLNIETGSSIFRIAISSLSHLEVYHKKLHFHTTDGQVRQIYGSLSDFESSLLRRTDFAKIHRSYIVNLSHVAEISSRGCVMFSGQTLPISRLLYNDVRNSYMAHLFSEEMRT